MAAATPNGMLALRNAIENASREPIDDDGIAATLRGQGARPHQLRALFEDCSLQALARAGASLGIEVQTILAAYAAARTTATACNAELDAALDHGWD